MGPTVSCLVTTARRAQPKEIAEARRIASQTGGAYTERLEKSLPTLAAESAGLPVIIVERDQVLAHVQGRVFFFHPSMTRLRLLGNGKGRIDPLLEAAAPREGDQVLDCTLGLAGDALLLGTAIGETGHILGLEASPVVAELVRLGLAAERTLNKVLKAAASRIEVVCADHREFLRKVPDGSFDLVCFDPMFDRPLAGSEAIEPLRLLARTEPLTRETLEEAIRVARRRVLVKSRKGAETLEALGIPHLSGGRWSRIVYGVVEV